MKRILIFSVVVLTVCIYLFAGCGEKQYEAAGENTQALNETDTEIVSEIDGEELYEEEIDGYYRMAYDYPKAEEGIENDTGVWEVLCFSESRENALKSIGYVFRDIDGDGTDELIILESDYEEDGKGERILALFTMVEGETVRVIEGWARNRYYLTKDDKIYNEGSSGAMYSTIATYGLKNGELECEDCFFTWESDTNPNKADVYHNNTGTNDRENSEKTDMNIDEFFALQEGLEEEIEKCDIKTFFDYALEHGYSLVTANFVSDADMSRYESVIELGQAEDYEAEVLFACEREVENFALYRLEFADVDEEGNVIFEKDKVLNLERFSPEKPVVFKVEVFGVMPPVGFSYTDEGEEKFFTVNMSGYDGSLVIVEEGF